MSGGEADAFMFNNAQTRTLKWDNGEKARHDVTRCLLQRERLRWNQEEDFLGLGRSEERGARSEEEDAHTCDSSSSLTVHHMHGPRWRSPHVLILISIQTSSLMTLMTFGSSVIDLWVKPRVELEHRYSPPENTTH